jgi:hypothetical protein
MADEAMAAPRCDHYWAWVSPAGTSEAAHLCMSCNQPDPDWLNEIAVAPAAALEDAADALDRLLRFAAKKVGREYRPETPNWLRERAAKMLPTHPAPTSTGAGTTGDAGERADGES